MLVCLPSIVVQGPSPAQKKHSLMSHNFKKKSAKAVGLRRVTQILWLPTPHQLFGPLVTPEPQSTCLSPNSAQAPTPCPAEGRGGPQEPVLRPAGSAGRRRGTWRTGRPPWGGSPGSQAWRGFRTQTPGARRLWSALAAPSPFFSQARTLEPSLPRTLCFVGLTKGAILMLLPQPCPIPMDSLGGFLLRPVGVGVGCGFLSGKRNSRFDSFQETRGPSSRMLLRKKAAAGGLVPTSSLSCTP